MVGKRLSSEEAVIIGKCCVVDCGFDTALWGGLGSGDAVDEALALPFRKELGMQ